MAIDDTKRLQWGPALRANLEPLTELHGIVQERIDRLTTTEEALRDALEKVEREKSEEGSALGELSAAADDAVRRARLVGVKLEAAFLEGEVPEDEYRAALAAAFPQGAQSIGATPAQRLEALRRIGSAFDNHASADPGGKLAALATEGADAIEAANVSAKREQEESRAANDTLAEARGGFDTSYLATKEIVGGLLREAGRLDELRDVFPDL